MNELEQLGQLWSDFLHAERQANKAVKEFCYYQNQEELTEEDFNNLKPYPLEERIQQEMLIQDMWDKQKLSNELYGKLLDKTEEYWYNQVK